MVCYEGPKSFGWTQGDTPQGRPPDFPLRLKLFSFALLRASVATSASAPVPAKAQIPLPQPKWEVPSALGTERVEQAALGTEYLAISTSPGQEVSHYDPPPKPSHSSSETKAGSGYSVPPTPVPTPAHTASQLCLEIQLRPCPRFPFLIPSIFSPLVLQLRRPSSIASSPSISLRRPFYPIWSTLARRAF
ncbi:NADH-ubiquinone oxidoreductase 30.4 kDa subunit [Fusarium oxysporum f. sp. albedinis]|nr:NADH-ubiquinone oxidoreductase 30.4 kDa subunit [Fusarium oxysporum f. sp. albedinis]